MNILKLRLLLRLMLFVGHRGLILWARAAGCGGPGVVSSYGVPWDGDVSTPSQALTSVHVRN